MFKKYLLIVCFVFSQLVSRTIEPYDSKYKEQVLEIAFQDPQLFIPGYSFIREKNQAFLPTLLSQTKIEFEQSLENPLVYFLMIFDDKKEVVGFISFHRTQEPSVEYVLENAKKLGVSLKDEDIKNVFPNIPLKIADAKKYVLIQSFAIDSSCRKQGYGKKLFNHALDLIVQKWPDDSYIELHVDKENIAAQNLYKNCSFECIKGPLSEMGIQTMRREIK